MSAVFAGSMRAWAVHPWGLWLRRPALPRSGGERWAGQRHALAWREGCLPGPPITLGASPESDLVSSRQNHPNFLIQLRWYEPTRFKRSLTDPCSPVRDWSIVWRRPLAFSKCLEMLEVVLSQLATISRKPVSGSRADWIAGVTSCAGAVILPSM